MKICVPSIVFLAAAVFSAPLLADSPATPWHVAGEMTESCTCQVPCTCQFGQGPSPTHHCASVSTFSIGEGSFGETGLVGAKFAIVFGNAKTVMYLDGRDAEQRAALKRVLNAVAEKSGWKTFEVREAPISQSTDGDSLKSSIGDLESMAATMLKGFDGKTPIVVENNNDFNVPRVEKGKTVSLKYRDDLGNSIDAKDSNAGRGHFDWTDKTDEYVH